MSEPDRSKDYSPEERACPLLPIRHVLPASEVLLRISQAGEDLMLLQFDDEFHAEFIASRIVEWAVEAFGDGLVRTPEDFGLQGEQPTHPKLLL